MLNAPPPSRRLKLHSLRALLFLFAVLLTLQGCSPQASDDTERIEEMNQLVRQSRYEELVAAGEQYLKEYPDSIDGRVLLAWGYTWTDQTDKAEPLFQKAIELDPKRDNAWVGLGVLYRRNDDTEKAIECHEKALGINPDNAEAYTGLLVIEIFRGNNEQAVEMGKKAWALDDTNPMIAANLALAYHCIGDRSHRDEYFEHAERLGYTNLDRLKTILYDGSAEKKPAPASGG